MAGYFDNSKDSLVSEIKENQGVIRDVVNQEVDPSERMYNAIMHAEHREKNKFSWYNPWIRTEHAPSGGSNAYGPVQLLSSTMQAMPKTKEGKNMINYTDEEKAFIKRYGEQGAEFYKHGLNKGKIDDYDPKFEYSGEGYEWSDEEKGLYKSVAKKIIGYEMKRTDPKGTGDISKFLHDWRFGSKDTTSTFEKNDPKYMEIVKKYYD